MITQRLIGGPFCGITVSSTTPTDLVVLRGHRYARANAPEAIQLELARAYRSARYIGRARGDIHVPAAHEGDGWVRFFYMGKITHQPAGGSAH